MAKKSYTALCVTCHGATAMGEGAAGTTLIPKPTNLKAMSGGHSDGDFAWKSVLKEDQVWDLVNFIQNLKNEHNKNDHDKNKKSDKPDKHSHKNKSHDEHKH